VDEVIGKYIQDGRASGSWTEKTLHEVEAVLRIFGELLPETPLANVSFQTMLEVKGKLARLPANLRKTPAYRDKKVTEVLKMDIPEPMHPTTLSKYLIRLSSLFKWAVRHGFTDRNYAEGLSVKRRVEASEERSTYSLEDIARMLAVEPFTIGPSATHPEHYWIPLIGLLSGMRLNEICQLYIADVVELDGIPCFDINEEKDKMLKNRASRRIIPIHPQLLKLGFMKHVGSLKEASAERLWPNLARRRDGYGHTFSQWFQRFNRANITDDPRKVFHSFRHTLANALKQAGVAEALIAEILGHASTSITMGRYGKRFTPSVLLSALEKWQPLDLEPKIGDHSGSIPRQGNIGSECTKRVRQSGFEEKEDSPHGRGDESLGGNLPALSDQDP
jgi:integrase